MSSRRRRLLALAVGGGALLGALPWLSPLYRWVPHQPRDTRVLFGDSPVVIAHRGASGVAPENTLAAFREAARMGVGFELDVSLCATGEPVILHDDTLDRTTTGSGPVSAAPLDALRDFDAGSWFDPRFAAERVPTLREVLAELGSEVVIDIELKRTDAKAALAKAVVAEVERAGLVERVFVTSFDPFLLEQVRLANPSIVRGQLVGDFKKSDLKWYEKKALQNLAFNSKVQPDLIVAQHDWLTPEWTAWLKARGYRVMVYTPNDEAAWERALAMGVDGLITDHPANALAFQQARR